MRLMLMMRSARWVPTLVNYDGNAFQMHDCRKFGHGNPNAADADDARCRVGAISTYSCELGRNCFPNA